MKTVVNLLHGTLSEHEQPIQVRPPSEATEEATEPTSHAPETTPAAGGARERLGLSPLEQDRVIQPAGPVSLGPIPQTAPADQGRL